MIRPRKFGKATLITPPVETAAGPIDTLEADFAVHCPRELLERLIAHAVKFREREVFGLLVGRPIRIDSRMRTVVVDFVAAQTFVESRTSYVEVSPAELLRMYGASEARREAEQQRIVGWFHTHPGHGIFMSWTDRANHRLYPFAWQVALVIDPSTAQWGFFATERCEVVPSHHVLLDVPPQVSSTSVAPIDAGERRALPEARLEPPSGLLKEEAPADASPASALASVLAPMLAPVPERADADANSATPVTSETTATPATTTAPASAPAIESSVPAVPPASAPVPASAPASAPAPARRRDSRWWLLAIGALGLVAAITLLHVRFSIQEARLEEGNVRIRDLQLRFDDFLKRGSPR